MPLSAKVGAARTVGAQPSIASRSRRSVRVQPQRISSNSDACALEMPWTWAHQHPRDMFFRAASESLKMDLIGAPSFAVTSRTFLGSGIGHRYTRHWQSRRHIRDRGKCLVLSENLLEWRKWDPGTR